MSAEQERDDFKAALLETLEKYNKPATADSKIKHAVSYSFPGRTSMDEAARFFFSMILKHRDCHFPEGHDFLYAANSIAIGYDMTYQCLTAGILIYEG